MSDLGHLNTLVAEREKSIAVIEKQLIVQEARRRAGLPHRDDEWETRATFALNRLVQERDALLDMLDEEL